MVEIFSICPNIFNYSSLRRNFVRHSSYRQTNQENTHPQTNSQYTPRFSSFRMQPKIVYDETWLSNKQYNTRVTAHADNKSEKTANKTNEVSSKARSPRTSTYQVSNGKVVHERVYPATVKTKLCLRVAVNGASKSMRGQLPLSNLNLKNGDFGDDAGMFVENRDYCFVGKLLKTEKNKTKKCF
jgi:hypothetical protein